MKGSIKDRQDRARVTGRLAMSSNCAEQGPWESIFYRSEGREKISTQGKKREGEKPGLKRKNRADRGQRTTQKEI